VQFEATVGVEALVGLKDLKQLREFHFTVCDGKSTYLKQKCIALERLYSWCGQNLPWLKLIGGTFEDCQCEIGEWDKFILLVHRMSPEFSGVSDLETLHAEGKLPEASLPNLKKLIYYGTEMRAAVNLLPSLSTYKNLTHLGLKLINLRHLVLILEHVGQQLSHLYFDSLKRKLIIDHYRLFHLCPNLVSYKQASRFWATHESTFKSHLSEHNFRNLQECTVANVPADLFQMICQAPSIRSIWCFWFKVSKEHCLVVELSDGFCNLETFKLTSLFGLTDECTTDDFETMVKNVVCKTPKLVEIQVAWEEWVEYTFGQYKWEKSRAIKFMQLIKKHD